MGKRKTVIWITTTTATACICRKLRQDPEPMWGRGKLTAKFNVCSKGAFFSVSFLSFLFLIFSLSTFSFSSLAASSFLYFLFSFSVILVNQCLVHTSVYFWTKELNGQKQIWAKSMFTGSLFHFELRTGVLKLKKKYENIALLVLGLRGNSIILRIH